MGTLIDLTFSITINASKEKAWQALWSNENYPKWTSIFHPGSYAETDWKKGSKVLFLTPEKDGMFSVIDQMITNELMVFKHLGVVEKGVEQPSSEKTKEWEGALESYALSEQNGTTKLSVTLQTSKEYEQYFNEAFPKALEVVKQIAEGK